MAKKNLEKEGLLSLAGSIKDPSFFKAMKEIISSRNTIKIRKSDFD